jgi:hypothetical protein
MSQSLVNRLIAFLKKPDALQYDGKPPVHNAYDDYAPRETTYETPKAYPTAKKEEVYADELPSPTLEGRRHDPRQASRLDAVVMRAVQQFNAQMGYVIRYGHDDRMHYCTGRDHRGRYVPYTEVAPDRRAVFLALDSGESQLFVQTQDDNTPWAILCGPLWIGNEVVGVLYLDNPARSRLHRGVFDVFCQQAARSLSEGVA